MEIVESLFYKKINPGDLLNIDFAVQQKGGGQTYLDLAGIDQDLLCSFLEYGTVIGRENPPRGDDRHKYRIVAKTIGGDQQQAIEFDPRNDRPNYKLSDQRANRHPAWSPQLGFPRAPQGARYANDVKNIPYLLVYIIRTSSKKYYAGFVNSPQMPNSWPRDCGLGKLFTGSRRGILFFDHETLEFSDNRECPFGVITSDAKLSATEVPAGIRDLASDAMELVNQEMVAEFDPTKVRFESCDIPTDIRVLKENPRIRGRQGHHTDHSIAQKNHMILGDAGERAVVEFEKRKLRAIGRIDLANRVEWVSKTQGDSLGYDVLSFEVNDKGDSIDLYIEVKTTTGGVDKPFEISKNEVDFSEEFPDNFVIIRIFEFKMLGTNIKYYKVSGSVKESFDLSPSSYIASIR